MIQFIKYHGTGNDFILIDDRKNTVDLSTTQIHRICDRHFGIGADGLILIREHPELDFEMVYYNSDGLPGSMCGNGGRCATSFAHSLQMIDMNSKFMAFDGVHDSIILSINPHLVKLKMSDVQSIKTHSSGIVLNTGSPHIVLFSDVVAEKDILSEAKQIRFSPEFRVEGVNVNFVHVKEGELFVRTYERGVEDETLSCGTGVTASVLAAAFEKREFTPGAQYILREDD